MPRVNSATLQTMLDDALLGYKFRYEHNGGLTLLDKDGDRVNSGPQREVIRQLAHEADQKKPILWLDARSGITAEDAADVTSWTSRDAGAYDFAEETAPPTYDEDGIYSGPATNWTVAGANTLANAGPTESLTALTVLALMSTSYTATGQVLAGRYDSGTNQRGWKLGVVGTQLDVFLTADGTTTGGYKQYKGPAGVTSGAPILVGFTWNAGTLKLYQNGAEVSVTKTNDSAFTSIHRSTAALTIGSGLNSGAVANPFQGKLSQVLIYNRVLSAADMLGIMQCAGFHA